MALPTASDNAFPSLLLTEGSAPASPASGKRRLYVLSSDHLAYLKDSSGTVVGLVTNPMTTKGDVILGDTSGVPSRLAAGTSTYVLTSNGAGAFPSWQAPAAGGAGALTLLEQHTASSSATLDFTTCITSTYDDYMFEFIGIVPATDSAMLTIRCSTDGGSTYDTGSNYASVALAMNSTGTASGYGRTTTSLSFHDDTGHNSLSSSGLPALAGSMKLYAPLSASNHNRFTWAGIIAYYSGGGLYQIDGSGTYLSTTATNAVRFLMSSGNIASGIIRAYGIAKT